MSKRVLFDTNVIIDVLTNRESFVAASKTVWQMHDRGDIDGYLSAVSLTVTRDKKGFVRSSVPALTPRS
jgi:hypothetical protein